MTEKQMANDNFTSNLAGMSMNQLYDIMSQMKSLIEQNQEQARQILVDSPGMAKSLFQAQILLGMVKTPQVMPSIQRALSQAPEQSIEPVQPPSREAKPLVAQVGQSEPSQIQIQIPARKQRSNHPVSSMPSTAVEPVTHQTQTMPSYSQQTPQQLVKPVQPSSSQVKPLPVQVSQQEVNQVQTQIPARKQQPNYPVSSMPSAAVPPVTHQSQTMPSYSQQNPQQSVDPVQPPSNQAKPLPVQVGQQEVSQVKIQIQARNQQPNHPVSSMPSAALQPVTHLSQTMPSYSQQSMQPAKEHTSTHGTSISHLQSSQVHTMPPHQFHSSQQPPYFHPTQKPSMSSQSQQSLHSQGAQHSLQPPLPSQPRPQSMQPFQHQHHSQIGPHAGFQTSAPSQSRISQQQFIGNSHPASFRFPPVQQPIPSQPPLHSPFQDNSHLSANFSQRGSFNMQMDRPSWMHGPPENSTGRSQLQGPPPLPGQMSPGNQIPHPPQLTHEMEKALLQQVMSLTPEQINLLPPEQRQQVLQLQQMLR